MDLDTAYIEPLIYEWLQHVHQDNELRERIINDGNEFNIPYMAVPMPVVKAIFVISGHFGLGPNARYLTIHLYDKFMCNHFCELYKAEISTGAKESSWTQTCQQVSGEAKLRLMSCMQLASKMDSHSKGLGIPQVMRVLRCIDRKGEYVRNTIFYSEFKVYKTLDYKIPLSTPLHCVEILLAATGLRENPMICDTCIHILDLAYLQHEQLYSHLHFMARGLFLKSHQDKKNALVMEGNILFLGAAVVLCSTFFLYLDETVAKQLVVKLSGLVEIVDTDIWDLANLLFILAVKDDAF